MDDQRYKASRILYESGEFSIFEANAILETPNLRDKFAMSIIPAVIADHIGDSPKDAVKIAYQLADEMLRIRENYAN